MRNVPAAATLIKPDNAGQQRRLEVAPIRQRSLPARALESSTVVRHARGVGCRPAWLPEGIERASCGRQSSNVPARLHDGEHEAVGRQAPCSQTAPGCVRHSDCALESIGRESGSETQQPTAI